MNYNYDYFFLKNANSTINIFEKREKFFLKTVILQLTFLRRIYDALKLSQIKIEVERFEIRIHFRNRWVFKQLIPEVISIAVLRARFLGTFHLKARGKSSYQSISIFEKQI